MNNLIVAFNAVVPMFVIMIIGVFLNQKKMIGETTQKQMNSLVFQVFLPILLFWNIYSADFHMVFRPKFLLFILATILIECLIIAVVVIPMEKSNEKRGTLIQGSFRSNFVILGIPIIVNLFGAENTGLTSISMIAVIPTYNILAVITLEMFRNSKINVKEIIVGIAKNPLIIGTICGIIALASGIKLPMPIEKIVISLADVATPLALVIMGASFKFSKIKENRKSLIFAVAVRLFIAPFFCIGVAAFMGYRGIELAVLMVIFAAPTAVSSFPMAQKMGGDGDLAAEIVVFTTMFSCITIFLWVFILKQLCLI